MITTIALFRRFIQTPHRAQSTLLAPFWQQGSFVIKILVVLCCKMVFDCVITCLVNYISDTKSQLFRFFCTVGIRTLTIENWNHSKTCFGSWLVSNWEVHKSHHLGFKIPKLDVFSLGFRSHSKYGK